jgi:PRTRC genetic system protein E
MFFTQINQMMNQRVDITLVIRKKDGTLTVSAIPKVNGLKDEAQNHIVPLVVTGTPEELDSGFIQAICQPMQKATGLLTNMSSFEKQAEIAEANSKAAKELKDKKAKEAKEKKEKFDKHMKNAEDLESQKRYSEALLNLRQAKTLAAPQALKQVEDKIKAINAKTGQISFFDTEETVTQSQPEQQSAYGNKGQFVTNGQAIQQPANGNITQQAIQQPVNANIPQQAFQQPVNGQSANGNTSKQTIQQPLSGNDQSLFQNVVQQPQSYNTPTNNGCAATGDASENERYPFTADTSIHREEEYAEYPDFPGYSDNRMSNNQIF